jgi:diguanylate cyclase (GGDEF)-like protein
MKTLRLLDHPIYLAIFLIAGGALLGVVCTTPLWSQIGIGEGSSSLILGLGFWTVIALIASAATVRTHTGTSIDAGTAPLMAATVLGGPLAGAFVGFFGTFQARELKGGIPVYGVFGNHLAIALPTAISGLVMATLGIQGASPSRALIISVVGVCTQMLLNRSCVTIISWCRRGGNAIPEMLSTISSDLSTGIIGGVMAQMCLQAGVWTILLFTPLLLLVREAMISAQLSLNNTALEEAVRTDSLTGLGNRLRLNEDLITLTASLSRSGRRAALVILDLDHFKLVNDLSGHLIGDEALRAVAAALRAGSRASDRLYRYGGEEFLVLTEDTDSSGVSVLASRLVETVSSAAIPHPGNAPYSVVTISAGFALIEPHGFETADQALRTADAALFEAKAAGRNRVCGLAA